MRRPAEGPGRGGGAHRPRADLAPGIEVSEPTTSHHLKQLLLAGLVTKRREGMNVYYRLDVDGIAAVAAVLRA